MRRAKAPAPATAKIPRIAEGSGTATGTVTGHFDNAITLPDSVYTGNGTDTIEWGTPVDGSFTNQLSFIPSDFTDQPKGQDFVAGRLYYRNGAVFGGTGINGVDLIINTTSSDPDFTQTLPLKITIVNTPNVADPIASADFIYFTDFPDRGSFRVLEGEETYVKVINSTYTKQKSLAYFYPCRFNTSK